MLCLGAILALHPLGGMASGQEATSAAEAPAAPAGPELELTAEAPLTFDGETREVVARQNARVTYGEWTLVADEIRYNQRDGVLHASGDIVATRPGLRILAERARYDLRSGQLEVENFRFGRPPYHAMGERGHGTADLMTFENVELFYGEPGPLTPRATVKTLTVRRADNEIDARGVRVSVGDIPLLALSGLVRPMQGRRMIVESRAGWDGNSGLQLGIGAYYPWNNSFNPGSSLDLFTRRGLLFGPGARYESDNGTTARTGSTDLAYINDRGDSDDRGEDVLGRPIDRDRYFWNWTHTERHGNLWTLNGELNWWSDSEVMRDFRDDAFRRRQDPDTFLEASLNGSGYILSAFTRVRPNDYQVLPERLPEVRFDLLPLALGQTGVLLEAKAGAAILREEPPGSPGEERRSDRLDIYTGLSRTFRIGRGITLTPVAGGRLTHYARTLDDRGDYTRWLGELGFDARLRASRVRELKKPLWGIDGIRHIIEPRLEYRYIPEAQKGAEFIPPIDRRAFLTQLQPLGLADRRDIDQLEQTHALRLNLLNLLETRREDYGSRELMRFTLGGDVFFSGTGGDRDYSDLHAELQLSPADWIDGWLFLRFDPDNGRFEELNTRIRLIDGEAWEVAFGTDFLRRDIEQYQLYTRYEINEAYDLEGGIRYDAREGRFNEVLVGVQAQLTQLWQVRCRAVFRDGPRRESSLGLRLSVRFLAF